MRFTCADGRKRWALISASDSMQPSILCTIVDITEQKQAFDPVSLANKKLNLLNSITRHDILNRLTGLTEYLELSRNDLKDPLLLLYVTKEEQAANAIRNQILFTRDYQNIGVHSPQWYIISEMVSLAAVALDIHQTKVALNLCAVEISADPLLEQVFTT